MTCGNVYDRDDRYIAKPLAGGSYQEIEDVFGVSITEENETSQRYFKGAWRRRIGGFRNDAVNFYLTVEECFKKAIVYLYREV